MDRVKICIEVNPQGTMTFRLLDDLKDLCDISLTRLASYEMQEVASNVASGESLDTVTFGDLDERQPEVQF